MIVVGYTISIARSYEQYYGMYICDEVCIRLYAKPMSFAPSQVVQSYSSKLFSLLASCGVNGHREEFQSFPLHLLNLKSRHHRLDPLYSLLS